MADHQPAGAPSQGTIDAFIKKTAYVLATLFSLFCLGTMLVFHLAPWIQLSFCLAATVILIGLTRRALSAVHGRLRTSASLWR